MKIKINSTLSIAAILLSAFTAPAQDCSTIHYEVNAGGDIEVCHGGSIMLGGIIGGDATRGVWRGGKGVFKPSRESPTVEYFPAEEETSTGFVLILVADNPKYTCSKARSQVRIRVNSEVRADAGEDQRICEGNVVQLHGVVTGEPKSISWITNGSGTFSNANKADAVYTPSEEDIRKGAFSLQMNIEPFGLCIPDSDAMIVMIDRAPQFTTISDDHAVAGKPVHLAITPKNVSGTVSWTSEGTGTFSKPDKAETTYTPSEADASKPALKMYASVTYASGTCTLKKPVVLHFEKGADKK